MSVLQMYDKYIYLFIILFVFNIAILIQKIRRNEKEKTTVKQQVNLVRILLHLGVYLV